METSFGFIGWCKEDNHDKVWGYFYRPTDVGNKMFYPWPTKEYGWNCCIFWGRRGKAMQFKADVTGSDLNKLVSTKLRKGYNQINQSKLIEIWPTFDEEMTMKLTFEVLAGKVK
jgi:hypothetical protein